MNKYKLYGVLIFAFACLWGSLPSSVLAWTDITVTCTDTCAPTYANYSGTVTLSLTCDTSSPLSYTGQLTVNGVSTPVHTQNCPRPFVTLTATPDHINPAERTTLTWTVSDATSCTASSVDSDWQGPVTFSGTDSRFVSPSANTTYTLNCIGPSGSTTREQTVLVPSGYISGSACQIPIGDSTCTSFVTWNSADFFGSVLIAQGIEEDPDIYPPSGVLERDVSVDNRTFTLSDQDGTFVDTDVVSVTCATGGIWSGGACLPAPEITMSAIQNTVRSGGRAVLDIEIVSGFDLSCTVSGGTQETFIHPGADFPPGANPSQIYEAATRPLTSAQIVRLECVGITNPDIVGEDEIRINVIPTIQEV